MLVAAPYPAEPTQGEPTIHQRSGGLVIMERAPQVPWKSEHSAGGRAHDETVGAQDPGVTHPTEGP